MSFNFTRPSAKSPKGFFTVVVLVFALIFRGFILLVDPEGDNPRLEKMLDKFDERFLETWLGHVFRSAKAL